MLTQARLFDLVKYDPRTGEFFRFYPRSAISQIKKIGNIGGRGYVQITLGRKQYYAHRLAWLYVTGKWPEHEIDHIDGNTSNNSFPNLRKASPSQNKCNRSGNKAASSAYKGVCWARHANKWMARVKRNGSVVHLGYFSDQQAAARAYDSAAIIHHGEFARLNFPQEHGRAA